jgi:hypothetical protein
VRLGIVVKEARQSDNDIAVNQESGPEERQHARQPDGPRTPYPGRGWGFHMVSVAPHVWQARSVYLEGKGVTGMAGGLTLAAGEAPVRARG